MSRKCSSRMNVGSGGSLGGNDNYDGPAVCLNAKESFANQPRISNATEHDIINCHGVGISNLNKKVNCVISAKNKLRDIVCQLKNNMENSFDTVTTCICYRLDGETAGFFTHKAFKHCVLDPTNGNPKTGHPKALPGFTVYYTDDISGDPLDITNWDGVTGCPSCCVEDVVFNVISACGSQHVSILPGGILDPDTSISLGPNPGSQGFISATPPDGTIIGGDCRGINAVDWQIQRNQVDQVASGTLSVIGGGRGNKNTGTGGFIGGGTRNYNYGQYGVIGGGKTNINSGNLGFVGGGDSNINSGFRGVIVGGISNNNSGTGSFIGGGNSNNNSGNYGFIGSGGINNNSGTYGVISGGINNNNSGYVGFVGNGINNINSGVRGVIVGGTTNTNSGTGGFIGGGAYNNNSGNNGFIGGGANNNNSGFSGVIGGGANNNNSGFRGVIVGGGSNTNSANVSFIGGGANNINSGVASFIGGGEYNNNSGNNGFIGGGANNINTGAYSGIVSGKNNNNISNESFIGGGINNDNRGYRGIIVGGEGNYNKYIHGSVVGGYRNTLMSNKGFIGGGRNNLNQGYRSVISGGASNIITGNGMVQGTGSDSTIGGGLFNKIDTEVGTIPGGLGLELTDSNGFARCAVGQYNLENAGPSGTAITNERIFVVGNGSGTGTRNNAFSVDLNGNAFVQLAYYSSGADYAEYFESVDGESIPVGTSVILVEDKIRIAEKGEQPIGVISSQPTVVGNEYADYWRGKYVIDEWGKKLMDDNKIPIISKDYDPNMIYIPRKYRKEWHTVALMGQVRIRNNSIVGDRWVKMKDISDGISLWLIK